MGAGPTQRSQFSVSGTGGVSWLHDEKLHALTSVVEEAAGNRKDNQITIDQIAPAAAEPPVDGAAMPPPDPQEMLDLSGALFGAEEEGA